MGSSSRGGTTRAGSRTGAPACGRVPLLASKCPSTTAHPDTNNITRGVGCTGALAHGKDPAGASRHPDTSVNGQESAGTGGNCQGQPIEPSPQRIRISPRRSGSWGPRRGLPRKAPRSKKESTAASRRKDPANNVPNVRLKDRQRRVQRRIHPLAARSFGAGRRHEFSGPRTASRREHGTGPTS